MILYLDTSSLVKLYVREDGSDEVKALFDRARVVATSQAAYAEACAAFARKHRQGDFTDAQYHTVITNLQRHWGAYFALDVSWPVSRGCPKTRISAGRDDLNAKEKRVIIGDKREE